MYQRGDGDEDEEEVDVVVDMLPRIVGSDECAASHPSTLHNALLVLAMLIMFGDSST